MKVECEVEEIECETDDGYGVIESVQASCGRCSNTAICYGTTERSVTRALLMLRETCPEGESNFYATEE